MIFWVLGLEIEHNGILLITDFSGRPTGEAFVQFTNVGDGKGALQKHKESMGHRFVGSHSNNNCLKARQNSNQYLLSREPLDIILSRLRSELSDESEEWEV